MQQPQESKTVLIVHSEGIGVSGTHTISVVADSWLDIDEKDDTDNVSQPIAASVVGPEVTVPAPTPFPLGRGSIGGSTWLFYGGRLVPQGRVMVSVYSEGGVLTAQGFSEPSGQYLIENIPAGKYNVFARLEIDGELYLDITDVRVLDNKLTPYVDLILY